MSDTHITFGNTYMCVRFNATNDQTFWTS